MIELLFEFQEDFDFLLGGFDVVEPVFGEFFAVFEPFLKYVDKLRIIFLQSTRRDKLDIWDNFIYFYKWYFRIKKLQFNAR